MAATVTASGHATSAGASTTVTSSATTAAGDRLFIVAKALSPSVLMTSVLFGVTPATRISNLQGHTYKYEIWEIEAPPIGTANIVVTSPSSLKLGVSWFAIANGSDPLVPGNFILSFPSPATALDTSTAVSASLNGPTGASAASLGIVLVSGIANNQTFALTSGGDTSLFEDDSVATTNLHLAAAWGSVPAGNLPGGTHTFTWTLGTAESWQALAFAIKTGTGTGGAGTGGAGKKSLWFGQMDTGISGTTPDYASLPRPLVWDSVEDSHSGVATAAGTVRNLMIRLGAAPGVGKSVAFTVRVNEADTALTVTISDSATLATLTGVDVAIAVGDQLAIKRVRTGTPTNSDTDVCVEFQAADAGVSIYGSEASGFVSSTLSAARYRGALYSSSGNWGLTADEQNNIVAVAGSITAYTIRWGSGMVSPSSPTYTCHLWKNGVKQDGTGGTVDTTLAITGTAIDSDFPKTGFDLPLVPGDTVYVSCMLTAGSVGTGPRAGVNCKFVATTPGEFNIGGGVTVSPSNTVTGWTSIAGDWDQVFTTPETGREHRIGPTDVTIYGLWVGLATAPGTSKSRTFSLRKTNANPSGGASVAISGASTTGNNLATTPTTYTVGDLISLQHVPSGTPTGAGSTRWAMNGVVSLANAAMLVTQSVALIGYDEDAENDTPPAVTPCSGGGEVAAGTDPSGGTSLAAATVPLAWVEITPIGGSTYRYASVGIPHGTPKYGRVLSLGSVKRVLADGDHGYESAVMSTTLSDTDGVLRALGDTLKGALVDYFIADLATIKAGGTARRQFRGILDQWSADDNREFSITSIDLLTARLTSIDAADLETPVVLIDNAISDQNPLERMFDKPVPEPYGALSDEDASTPVGVWEFKHVGFQTLTGDEDLGNCAVFLVGLGAVKKIQSVFGADLLSSDPPTRRIKLGASAFGDWRTDPDAYLLVPKMTGWPEPADYSVRNARRYTLMLGKDGHPSVVLAVQNRIPFVGNLCAREATGDTSGTLITSGPWQLLHWLNNGAAQQATGNWLSLASFGDFSIFNRSSFDTVGDLCDALGYEFAGVIGGDYQQESWRERVTAWCRAGGFDIGTDRHGRAMLAKLDVSSGTSAATFTTSNILDKSVKVDQRLDAVENVVRYSYAENYKSTLPEPTPEEGARLFRDPFDGKWGSGLQTLTDSASITALGGDPKGIRRSALQEYRMTRDAATADAVAAERLALLAPASGRAEVTLSVLLKDGTDLELGNVVTITHWDLPWTGARRCQVRGIETNLDDMTVTLTVRDVDDLLA